MEFYSLEQKWSVMTNVDGTSTQEQTEAPSRVTLGHFREVNYILLGAVHCKKHMTRSVSPCKDVFTRIRLFLVSFWSTFSRENGGTVPYVCASSYHWP